MLFGNLTHKDVYFQTVHGCKSLDSLPLIVLFPLMYLWMATDATMHFRFPQLEMEKRNKGKRKRGKKKRNGPLPSSSLSLSKVNPQCIHIHSYSDVCSLVFFSERREKEPLDPSVIRTDGRESEGHRDLRFRTALCLGAPFQR